MHSQLNSIEFNYVHRRRLAASGGVTVIPVTTRRRSFHAKMRS
jgi:hypothetical protein